MHQVFSKVVIDNSLFKNISGEKMPEDLAKRQTLFYKRTPVAREQRIKSELRNMFLHRFTENACISRLFSFRMV